MRTHNIGLVVYWAIEEACDHADAAVLDLGSLRVLLIVDEVLVECFSHELFNFVFHIATMLVSSFSNPNLLHRLDSRSDKAGQVESRSAIEGKVVLDHPIGYLWRHLLLWHGVGWQVLTSELGAINRHGLILAIIVPNGELPETETGD